MALSDGSSMFFLYPPLQWAISSWLLLHNIFNHWMESVLAPNLRKLYCLPSSSWFTSMTRLVTKKAEFQPTRCQTCWLQTNWKTHTGHTCRIQTPRCHSHGLQTSAFGLLIQFLQQLEKHMQVMSITKRRRVRAATRRQAIYPHPKQFHL